MPELIVNVQVGFRTESDASETLNPSAADPTVYDNTHNLHRQAQKIKETIPFRHKNIFVFFVASRGKNAVIP